MTEKKIRRGISGLPYILLLVCMLTGFGVFGTVSATGTVVSDGRTGSGTDSYSSSVLYTNWNAVTPAASGKSYGGQVYEKQITNPTTCVSGINVFLPEADKPKPKNINYLAYALHKYSDKLTREQYGKLSQACKGVTLTGEDPDSKEAVDTFSPTLGYEDLLDEFCSRAHMSEFSPGSSPGYAMTSTWK